MAKLESITNAATKLAFVLFALLILVACGAVFVRVATIKPAPTLAPIAEVVTPTTEPTITPRPTEDPCYGFHEQAYLLEMGEIMEEFGEFIEGNRNIVVYSMDEAAEGEHIAFKLEGRLNRLDPPDCLLSMHNNTTRAMGHFREAFKAYQLHEYDEALDSLDWADRYMTEAKRQLERHNRERK